MFLHCPCLGDFATPTPSCARSPYHTPLRTIGHMTNLMMVSPRCVVLPDVMRHGRPHAPTAIDRYRYVGRSRENPSTRAITYSRSTLDGPVSFLHLHSRRTTTRSTSALRRSVSVSLLSHLVLMRSNLISRIIVGPSDPHNAMPYVPLQLRPVLFVCFGYMRLWRYPHFAPGTYGDGICPYPYPTKYLGARA